MKLQKEKEAALEACALRLNAQRVTAAETTTPAQFAVKELFTTTDAPDTAPPEEVARPLPEKALFATTPTPTRAVPVKLRTVAKFTEATPPESTETAADATPRPSSKMGAEAEPATRRAPATVIVAAAETKRTVTPASMVSEPPNATRTSAARVTGLAERDQCTAPNTAWLGGLSASKLALGGKGLQRGEKVEKNAELTAA